MGRLKYDHIFVAIWECWVPLGVGTGDQVLFSLQCGHKGVLTNPWRLSYSLSIPNVKTEACLVRVRSVLGGASWPSPSWVSEITSHALKHPTLSQCHLITRKSWIMSLSHALFLLCCQSLSRTTNPHQLINVLLEETWVMRSSDQEQTFLATSGTITYLVSSSNSIPWDGSQVCSHWMFYWLVVWLLTRLWETPLQRLWRGPKMSVISSRKFLRREVVLHLLFLKGHCQWITVHHQSPFSRKAEVWLAFIS